MKIRGICLIAGLTLASAIPAAAQGNDVAYCHALVSKYQTYLGTNASGRHSGLDQNVEARIAIDKCNAGDASGIPVLEQKLRTGKIDLPARN